MIRSLILLLVSISAFAQVRKYELGEVTIEVYLPPKYTVEQDYKVVYANDGEWLFGESSWDLDKQLNMWIKEKKIDPVIVVAIYNNNSRESNFIPYSDPTIQGYSPNALSYTKLITKKVIPFVDSMFPTSKERAIMGVSFGGLHSTWAGLNCPDIFSFIIAQSPSYWVADFKIHEEPVKDTNQKIWIDIGTKDWDDVLSMFYHLSQKGFMPGQNLFYYEDVNGTHSAASWKQRLLYPLILFTKGHDSELSDLSLQTEYIPSVQRKGHYFSRVNPVATLRNGVRFTPFPFIFNTEEGNAEVSPYGSFRMKEKSMDNISAEYLGKKATVKVSWKDNPMNQ
ncbi:MAG: alpha/beta hydrolase-fold protein [Cyclobacteriaceae bacterium]